ncbi:hypothetical protein J3459_013900 [Metarhizium acridum]|nr:hypothetical protein J3459_013900 [Metarhizium acridum]
MGHGLQTSAVVQGCPAFPGFNVPLIHALPSPDVPSFSDGVEFGVEANQGSVDGAANNVFATVSLLIINSPPDVLFNLFVTPSASFFEHDSISAERTGAKMSLPLLSIPPSQKQSYIVDQLEGERITIPGSKGAFRILASSKQTDGGIAVFSSGAVISDAPGFHWHDEAHDVFLVTKGFLKLWNGDKCKMLGPGDFAYIPPKFIHNPQLLGPHTETLGLIAPGDWVDFFRYVSETYSGIIVPEDDSRDLKSLLIPKVMAAKDKFDVHFARDHDPAEVSDWDGTECVLPGPLEPYYLRGNTGPRWMLGAVMSRPFIHASQCSGKFAISSIESSKLYDGSLNPFSQRVTFEKVAHCFVVMEGVLGVKLYETDNGGEDAWSEVREGQTVVIPAGQTFSLCFKARYVRAISFTNGTGVEEIIRRAGTPYQGFVLPEQAQEWNDAKFRDGCSSAVARLG